MTSAGGAAPSASVGMAPRMTRARQGRVIVGIGDDQRLGPGRTVSAARPWRVRPCPITCQRPRGPGGFSSTAAMPRATAAPGSAVRQSRQTDQRHGAVRRTHQFTRSGRARPVRESDKIVHRRAWPWRCAPPSAAVPRWGNRRRFPAPPAPGRRKVRLRIVDIQPHAPAMRPRLRRGLDQRRLFRTTSPRAILMR